jgi:hypothetical protein
MHPGVVDQNIEATEDLDGLQNRFFRCGRIRHVGADADCLSPAGTNLFYAFTGVQEIGDQYAHALGSQGHGNAAADASRAPGDKGHINDFGLRHESSSSLRPFRMCILEAEIWHELIDPRIRCQGETLTCFIDR